jgi:hypothetical protein
MSKELTYAEAVEKEKAVLQNLRVRLVDMGEILKKAQEEDGLFANGLPPAASMVANIASSYQMMVPAPAAPEEQKSA